MGDLSDVMGGDIQATQEDIQPSFGLLPPGDYLVLVGRAEVKPTRKGGLMLELEFELFEPAGRKLWHRINIQNASPKAEEIGRAELRSMIACMGLGVVGSTDQLLGQQCIASVKISSGDRGEQNEIRGFKPAGEAAQPVPPRQATPPRQAPAPRTTPPFPAMNSAPAASQPAAAAPARKAPWQK